MEPKITSQLDISFPGKISNEIFNYLAIEIVKQLQYQREQIPLPVDQLKLTVFGSDASNQKQCFSPRRVNTGADSLSTSVKGQKLGGHINRQITQAYETYNSLFSHVSDVFSQADIHEMIILLGPTLVSPRESYHIRRAGNVSCPLHELPNLPLRKCMATLFKEMITNSCLWSDKHIPVTNTTVLLKLNPELPSGTDYLEPMLSFNPGRFVAKRFVINLNVECGECETLGGSEHCSNKGDKQLSSMPCDVDNLVWVKVNPTLKGLKDSAFKK